MHKNHSPPACELLWGNISSSIGNVIRKLVIPFISLPFAITTFAGTSYSDAKDLFLPGDQDYCLDKGGMGDPHEPGGKYKAGPNDRWIAMVKSSHKWRLENAGITRNGRVKSRKGIPFIFFKRSVFPFGLGDVFSTSITFDSLEAKNIKKSRFVFQGQSWQWTEWSGDNSSFYLTNGIRKWSGSSDKLIKQSDIAIPHEYLEPSYQRDGYDGYYQLIWAGDINNDKQLDFIVSWHSKEAWGQQLWIGKKSRGSEIQFHLKLESSDACS